MLAALAVGGCMRTQQTTWVIDPNTGQPVPVMSQQELAQHPQYDRQNYPEQFRQQAAAPSDPNSRGLFGQSAASAQQSYAQAPYPPQPAAQPQAAPSSGRGLFNNVNMQRSAPPQYAPQTYAPQNYPPQVYAQPQPQPPSVVQYIPPGQPAQQTYAAQQSYAGPPQYVAPQPAPQYTQQGGSYAAAPYGYASAPANQPYTLDSGDKLRVTVFGQDGITNSYTVDAGGNVNLPLIGAVPARRRGTPQLSQMIAERLKQGYVREPHVTVEVEAYRPFFILGEVTNPGQYPYVANMTAETAIAIAGGFAPRAQKGKVELTRNAPGQQMHGDVPLGYPLRPGDTILVKERWF
jgi:polysaccharide export outer membrane protein